MLRSFYGEKLKENSEEREQEVIVKGTITMTAVRRAPRVVKAEASKGRANQVVTLSTMMEGTNAKVITVIMNMMMMMMTRIIVVSMRAVRSMSTSSWVSLDLSVS